MTVADLCLLDPVFAPLVARVGPFALAARAEDPYEALASAIASQQLNTKVAQTILGRLKALSPSGAFPRPRKLLALDEAVLRGCGFSGAKIAALRDIAQKKLDRVVPTRREAEALSDEELIARLTVIRGVGQWTVEMLLIFTLGRPDVLPVDDFGVREGWRLLTGAEAQLKPKALAALGQRWSPHRSMAAWYLWRAAEAGKAVPKKRVKASA